MFSVSLQGTHDDGEDQDQLSRKLPTYEVEAYSHEQPEPFRQDPDNIFCWSSPCVTRPVRVFPPRPSHFQIPIRPGLHDWSSSPQLHSAFSRNPTVRTISPTYSYARSSSSSTHSRNINFLSSISDVFRHNRKKNASSEIDTSTVPLVPKVLEKHGRVSLYGFQRGGKPLRPSSRPSMPPAAFWRYVAEKQAGRASSGMLPSWQIDSDRKKREQSTCRYPIIATRPEKAITRNKRLHCSNDRAARRRSYESIRKGIIDVEIYSDGISCPDLGDGWRGAGRKVEMEVRNRDVNRRSQSRRLVKKRQPWDAEPRCKRSTAPGRLPNQTQTRPVRPFVTPKHGKHSSIGGAQN